MIAIVCLDEARGMLFHGRRQSRDRAVIWKIMDLCEGKKLWINPCSAKLFENEEVEELVIEDDFLWKSEEGEYCFVEKEGLAQVEERLERIIVFWWNRKYPGDFFLDIDLEQWNKMETEDFPGYSHETITKEVYRR